MSVEEVVEIFVVASNSHDVDAIGQLMSDDHVFVDSGGGVHADV